MNVQTGSGAAAATMLTQTEPMSQRTVGRFAGYRAETRAWLRAHPAQVGVVVAASTAVLGLEFVRPSVLDAATVRATLETAMMLLALAAAWLLRAKFAQSRRLRDLLLVAALLTLGLVRLCWYLVPAALDLRESSVITAAAQWGELLAGAIFAAAALVSPDHLLAVPRRSVWWAALLSTVLVVLSAVAALAADGLLAGGLRPSYRIGQAAHHPFALMLIFGATGLLAAATWGFRRQEQGRRNGVASLLAGGVLLLAVARLSYTSVSTLAVHMIAPREVLSVLAFSLFLAAAVRHEFQARSLAARAAATAERQRVARDLHDGLAQDLAFIAAHGDRMSAEMGDQHPVVIAARRALAVSRTAIAELSDSPDTTVQEALEAVAHELRDRFDIAIAVHAQPAAELSMATRQDISRIVREAIANAARHGGARNVMVSLTRSDEALRLRVCDDGCGILMAVRTDAHEGFGLRSMRERAAAAGGCMTIHKPGTGGTVLEVVIP